MVGGTPEMDLLRDAPCFLAFFHGDGNTITCTDRLALAMPEIRDGLIPLLDNSVTDPSVGSGFERLNREGRIKLLARRTDGSVWRMSLCRREDRDLISLHAEDITDEYEELLRQRLVLELVDKTPDGIGIARHDHTGLWLNPAMRDMMGVDSPEQIRERRIEEVQAGGIADYSIDGALELADREGFFQGDALITDIHGHNPLEVSQVIIAHHDTLLDRPFFSTIVRDITRLKSTQRALTEAQKELRLLLDEKDRHLSREKQALDHSRDIWRSLVEQNRDLVLFTNTEGKILFSNRGFLPDDVGSLTGTTVHSLIEPNDQENVEEYFHSLLEGDISHINTEARILCPNGQIRHCVLLINRLKKNDGLHAATWIISDASESLQNRERLQANEKMAATGRMAARIAHEINNPLAAIKSSLELVRMEADHSSETAEYLQLMESELNRVSNIVRQMYGLYRPEQDLARPLCIHSIINDCITLLRSTANQRGILIDPPAGDSVRALASEASLRQILFNLMQNAIDASPAGGTIRLETERHRDRVRIHVMDQGSGLGGTSDQQVFEPFFTTKDSYSGSGLGLGLSVSASLAKGMGGDLQLRDMPGTGACATLTLKSAPEE